MTIASIFAVLMTVILVTLICIYCWAQNLQHPVGTSLGPEVDAPGNIASESPVSPRPPADVVTEPPRPAQEQTTIRPPRSPEMVHIERPNYILDRLSRSPETSEDGGVKLVRDAGHIGEAGPSGVRDKGKMVDRDNTLSNNSRASPSRIRRR